MQGIQCDPCGDILEQKDIINNHQKNTNEDTYKKMKIIERELETKINLQRIHLVSEVLKLKQMEESANGMCMCKRFCRNCHKKHNWQRSASHEIVSKLKSVQSCYSCNLCDKNQIYFPLLTRANQISCYFTTNSESGGAGYLEVAAKDMWWRRRRNCGGWVA
jgi:hypothetical protein